MPAGAIPFPFGMCRICKDKATGIHYGVATCEGCKGFFKRSITRGDKYKCFFGNLCDLTPKNRNRCKSCRFKRCMEVGMSVEAVRMGRIPKMDKEKALEAFHQGGSDYSKLELEVESTGVGTYGFKINTKHGSEDSQCEMETKPCVDMSGSTSNLSPKSGLTSQLSVTSHPKPSSAVPVGRTDVPVNKNSSVLESGENFAYPTVPLENINSSNTGNNMPHSVNNHFGVHGAKTCTASKSRFQSMEYDTSIGDDEVRMGKIKDVDTPHYNSQTTDNYLKSSPVRYQEKVPMPMQTETVVPKQEDPPAQQYPFYHPSNAGDHQRGLVCHSAQFAQPSYQAERFSLSNGAPTPRTNYMTVKEPVYGETYHSRIANQSDHRGNRIQNPNDMYENIPTDLSANPYCDYNMPNMTHSNGFEKLQKLSVSENNHFSDNHGNRNISNRMHYNGFDGHLPVSASTEMTNSFHPPPAHHNDFKNHLPTGYNSPSNGSSMNVGLPNSLTYSPVKRDRDINVFSPVSTQMSETESQSIEAARCPTPVGSVFSGEGSSSSQRSGFSPSVIQILFDEVLKSCDGHTMKERLTEKLEKNNVDKNLIFRMFQLIDHSERGQKLKCDISDTRSNGKKLPTMPVSKKECMDRFLHDLDLDASYSSQDELDRSRNDPDTHSQSPGRQSNGHLKRSPLKQDLLNSLRGPIDVNGCDLVTSNTGNKEGFESRGQVMSDDISSSSAACNEMEETEKLKATLVSMNLAQKILNRFKSEHREKIKLYREGQLHIRVMTDSEDDIKEVYKKIIGGISGLNDRILGFCQHVPGFSSLSSEDQEKLTKRSYYDLWTLSYAEYFRDGESYWILPSGEIYSSDAMRKILNDEMVDTIFKFAEKFNALEITDLEMGVLGAVRLTAAEGLELEDRPTVESMHSHLLNTLAYEVAQNHPTNHARILIDMFSLQPLLDAVNRIQKDIIANFSTKSLDTKT